MSRMFWYSLVSCGLVILYKMFEWTLVERLTVFLAPILWLALLAHLLIVMIVSLGYAICRRQDGVKALLPTVMVLATFLFVIFTPLTEWKLRYDFSHNFQRRLEVVNLVKTGRLERSNWSVNTSLPPEYSDLSVDGEIKIERTDGRTSVFFYTFRGVLDNFSGFMYRSDGVPPEVHTFNGDFKRIDKLRDNWFWVVSY